MPWRSQPMFTRNILRLLLLVVAVLLHAFTASAATRMRGGSSAPLSRVPLRTQRRHRWLSLVNGRSREEGEDAIKEESGANSNKLEAASPYGIGGAGTQGADKAALPSEAALMTRSLSTATKPKSTDTPAVNATSNDEQADASAGNATTSTNSAPKPKAPPSASSNSSQNGMDDLVEAQDDDNGTAAASAHYSQWDVTNATDFDGMLKNQTYRGPGLLPPDDAEPPPHWDVAMTALFAGLAVLLCVGTVVRRYRNQQRQRASYEPIHSLTV